MGAGARQHEDLIEGSPSACQPSGSDHPEAADEELVSSAAHRPQAAGWFARSRRRIILTIVVLGVDLAVVIYLYLALSHIKFSQ